MISIKIIFSCPFTDLTTGNESYQTGRYIDFTVKDIKNGELVIDFNKAYNPSCAYVSDKYNCPVPPRENNLTIAIKAGGEMNFAKKPLIPIINNLFPCLKTRNQYRSSTK
ncbi:MAG: DUF1684 domain-containing protein [Bacteroidota bacterium]